MTLPPGESGAGLYLHIPFCERLCPYCDFAVKVAVDIPHRAYTDAVLQELALRADEIAASPLRTIYFGGGTPALLSSHHLDELLKRIRDLTDVCDDAEITLETNPNQVTAEALDAWQTAGFNRLSIGCQSFQDRHLKALRRNHDAARALQAVELAADTFPRVSLDLIFAGPDQTDQEWEADLATMQRLVTDHGLSHVSAYQLTIEPGTAFALHRRRGRLNLPSEERSDRFLSRLVEATAEVGLRRYEVSNFAAPGHESRHNTAYWKGIPYVGVGVGAHSLAIHPDGGATRRENPRRYSDYMDVPGRPAHSEHLSARQHLGERLFLAGRSTVGLDLRALQEAFADVLTPDEWRAIDDELHSLVSLGLLHHTPPAGFHPTDRGLNLSDTLAERLFGLV